MVEREVGGGGVRGRRTRVRLRAGAAALRGTRTRLRAGSTLKDYAVREQDQDGKRVLVPEV